MQSSLQTTLLTSAPTNSASCYQKWETLGTLTSNHPDKRFFRLETPDPANPTEQHSFKAVYSNNVSSQKVAFYVDGKLLWNQMCPDISGKDFHMVLTSHKVSAKNIDISQNRMEVKNAVFSDGTESDQSFDNQNFASSAGMPLLWPLEKSIWLLP